MEAFDQMGKKKGRHSGKGMKKREIDEKRLKEIKR